MTAFVDDTFSSDALSFKVRFSKLPRLSTDPEHNSLSCLVVASTLVSTAVVAVLVPMATLGNEADVRFVLCVERSLFRVSVGTALVQRLVDSGEGNESESELFLPSFALSTLVLRFMVFVPSVYSDALLRSAFEVPDSEACFRLVTEEFSCPDEAEEFENRSRWIALCEPLTRYINTYA